MLLNVYRLRINMYAVVYTWEETLNASSIDKGVRSFLIEEANSSDAQYVCDLLVISLLDVTH